jgi:natural product precursor
MKEKLNLTNLTKMSKKDLQETKGGLVCRCICICTIFPDESSETENSLGDKFYNRSV